MGHQRRCSVLPRNGSLICGNPRPRRRTVAQVSNLLYRGFPIRSRSSARNRSDFPAPADWKSATQQIGNLRYAARLRSTCLSRSVRITSSISGTLFRRVSYENLPTKIWKRGAQPSRLHQSASRRLDRAQHLFERPLIFQRVGMFSAGRRKLQARRPRSPKQLNRVGAEQIPVHYSTSIALAAL